MKSKEIHELSPQELEKKLRDTREEVMNLRLRKETGQVENPTRIRVARREIARMETIRREKLAASA